MRVPDKINRAYLGRIFRSLIFCITILARGLTKPFRQHDLEEQVRLLIAKATASTSRRIEDSLTVKGTPSLVSGAVGMVRSAALMILAQAGIGASR